VRTKALVIAGQNDRITVPGASHVLAMALPNARFVEIRRAAHAPFLSHRKEFTAELERFLCAEEVEVGGVASSTKKKRMKARARKKLQASSR
jgi:hypothetical protein